MKYKLFPWLIGFLLLVVIFLASFGAPAVTQPDLTEKQVKATYNAPFTIHFSHIMHRNTVEENFVIYPKTDGDFRWKDFWTLEFVPDEPLTIGDEYRVVIKGEAKSIWWKKIGYDVSIDYKVTGPPYVLFADPPAGEVINAGGAITVMFDRPMDFEAKSKKDLIEITPSLSGDIRLFGNSAFQFMPRDLEVAQTYELTVPSGLAAIDGGDTTEDYSWIITTPDLAVSKSEPYFGAKEIELDQAIRLHFEGEVPLEAIKPGTNALLYPSNDLDSDTELKMDGFFNTEVTYDVDEEENPIKNTLIFVPTFEYQPGQDYRFVLKSDKDLHLAEDYELEFRTMGGEEEEELTEEVEEEPALEVEEKKAPVPALWEEPPMEYFIRGENPRLKLKEAISETAILSVCQVSSNEFIRVTANSGWNAYRCRDTEPEQLDPGKVTEDNIINLNYYFRLKWATGVYYASVSQGDKKEIRHFMIEDSTLLLKRSDSDLLVWALDVKSGKPIADMDIEVLAYDGEDLADGSTDEWGIFSLDQALDEGVYVRAKKEDEDGVSRFGFVADRWELDNNHGNNDERRGIFVLLDQHLYLPGDNLKIKGIWRELNSDVLALPSTTQLTVNIEDTRHNTVVSKRIPMRRNGSFDGTLTIPDDLAAGQYLLSVSDLNYQRLSEPVPVQVQGRLADLRLEWQSAKKDLAYDTEPVFLAKARYRNGIPAGKIEGEYRLYRRPSSLEYQQGAVSYGFNNTAGTCAEECTERELVLEEKLVFDLEGELELNLNDKGENLLAAGYKYNLELTAALPGGEKVGLNHAFEIHQGSYDLGLGVKHAIIEINETIDASVFALSFDGRMKSGEKVKLALLSDDKKKQIYEKTLETQSVPVTASIPIAPTMEDGVYLLQARSQDEERNEIISEKMIYVNTNPLQTVSDELLLAVDQPKYFVGGRAHLLINEPSASEDNPVPVILSYERNGLLGYEALELTNPVTRTAVSIEESMMPYFTVNLTRFNRGLSPSFSSVSETIEVGYDDSRIFMDLSFEPQNPVPGEEVTVRFKTYDYQNRPLAAVITLNLLDREISLPKLSYKSFFPTTVIGAKSASNISLQPPTYSIPDGLAEILLPYPDSASSVYFDPLITTNINGEGSVKMKLPDQQGDFFALALATRETGQFGVRSRHLRMNRELEIQPILPSMAVPGDQTVLAALVKNISDKPVQSRLEFVSEDLSPKGDVTRNFSLEPGQQTEIPFSVFIDTTLTKDELQLEFRSGNDKAVGKIPLKHYKTSQPVPNTGLLSDIWTGHIKLPAGAYSTLGTLEISLGGSPLVMVKKMVSALQDYPHKSTHLMAVKLLLEEDDELLQSQASGLLMKADSSGGYRFWNEVAASPRLTALALLAYSEAASREVHIDSLQLKRSIDFLWKSMDQESLNPNDKAFIMWVLGKNNQFDTESAILYFQERETMDLRGRSFLLMNLAQIVLAGQASMSSAYDTLKAEILDEAITVENMIYFDAPPKNIATVLYALSELDTNDSVKDGLAAYLASRGLDLIHEIDPEEVLWMTLAFRSYAKEADTKGLNFITRLKLNGELILDQSVTSNSYMEVYESSVPLESLNQEGINDMFVKKEGGGDLYLDAHLPSYMDVSQVTRLEEGLNLVRTLHEKRDDGSLVPADSFRKGKRYVSQLEIIVPKDQYYLALTDSVPAGMKISSSQQELDGNFSWQMQDDSQITYYAPYLPAGVYTLQTELQAALSGSYMQFPAIAQAMFEPATASRTNGGMIQILD